MAETTTNRPNRMVTAEEVAQEFQISKQLISKLVASGELTAIRVGRLMRFRESDIEAFVERSTAQPTARRERDVSPQRPLLQAEALRAKAGKRFTHQIIARTTLLLEPDDSIKIDWGDNSSGTGKYNPDDGTIRASHAYTSPGVYTFTLVVKHQGVQIQVQEKISVEA